MKDLSKFNKMSYNEALSCGEARNCGLYIILDCDNVIYVGRASSITIKRRLAEHVTYDNQFNTLTRKIAKYLNLPLKNTEEIFEFILNELKFVVIPYPVHRYNNEDTYSFDNPTRKEIIEEEKVLIKCFDPPLNKKKISVRLDKL